MGKAIDMELYDVAIVGGGIAAHTAALTAKTLLLHFVWLGDGEGKTALAKKVNNFPAAPESGEEFERALKLQREQEGLPRISCRVNGIFKTPEGYVLTADGREFLAKAIILATGADAAGLLRGEQEFLGRGVSYCASCDGALYRGKRVAAILSSPKFMREAVLLAGYAQKVLVFSSFKPTLEGEKFEWMGGIPDAVVGTSRAEGVEIGGKVIAADGVFFFKESAPPASLLHGLRVDGAHVAVGRDLSTNLEGVFAAGDITGRPYQFAKAAGEGLMAAYGVRDFLYGKK